ncbi:Seryl-tRNA synthetase, mitochondrial [Atta colombica]|uniref:serine--tRNA ligase n=1 Tax=Atta colombica TaxID=520822 RepID=A0A195BHU9_9HYME|nr:Seryl-tRNA synthetase, mitochondrial [Atta colombica]
MKRSSLIFSDKFIFSVKPTTPKKNIINTRLFVPEPEYDTDFVCNSANRDIIFSNIKSRKGIGDIDKVLEYSGNAEKRELLLQELSKIPNCTHPAVIEYGDEPKLLKKCGRKPQFDFEPQEFAELATNLKAIRTHTLGPVTGQRSYILLGDLAELEEALIQYTLRRLMKHGFKLLSVPDIILTEIIERCGLIVNNNRTLVYNLDSHYDDNYSLSGTAEMSLASKLMNTIISYDTLPMKLAAVSRCYRAEGSGSLDERGIYRQEITFHQFTKVEMFVCSKPNQSEEVFQDLQNIQEGLFSSLGLHFQIMDMPSLDLGSSAYRKCDMEGWMPGRKLYGELSSCSNCTDYQSRRLNIKYRTKDGNIAHVHTLNGTACAIPRMLIALCETYQTRHHRITIPNELMPLMKGKTLIKKQPIADMRTYKYKQKLNVKEKAE